MEMLHVANACLLSILYACCCGISNVAVQARAVPGGEVMFGPCSSTATACSQAASRADVSLGGLFPVHVHVQGVCGGTVQPENLQWVEAMRDAVDTINANDTLLSGVTLGYEMRDTCRLASHTLLQCLEFLGKSTGGDACTAEDADPGTRLQPSIAGVVGAFASSVSLRTTELLGLFQLPMVSYGSTSPQLSRADNFPYFLRTIPSDDLAAAAIARTVVNLKWEFIGLVHTSDTFGRDGIAKVKSALEFCGTSAAAGGGGNRTQGVTDRCQAESWEIKDGANATDEVYDRIWRELLLSEPINRTTVVVMFTQEKETSLFFKHAENDTNGIMEQALKRNITFIGVDAWGDIITAVRDAKQVSRGSISPIPLATPYAPFETHWTGLNPAKNADNPWLRTLWEDRFGCTISDPVRDTDPCITDNSLAYNFTMSSKVPYVYHSVFAFAHALDSIYRQNGKNKTRLLAESRTTLRQVLKNVSFSTIYDTRFFFDANGDPGISTYDIKNMQVKRDVISFPVVGSYEAVIGVMRNNKCTSQAMAGASNESAATCQLGQFSLNETMVVWNDVDASTPPVSVCSKACPAGTRRMFNSTGHDMCQTCCWQCDACPEDHLSTTNNSDRCAACPDDTTGTPGRRHCSAVAIEQFAAPSPVSTVMIVVTLLALIAALVALVWILMRYGDSFFVFGREPTLLFVLGLVLCFVSVLVESNGPTVRVCLARTVLSAVGMTTVASLPLVFIIHRLTVDLKLALGSLFIYPLVRFVGMLVVQSVTVALFVVLLSPDDRSRDLEVVHAHSKVVRACGFAQVDIACQVYLMVLSVAMIALSVFMIWMVTHRDVAPVVYDPKSRIFALIAVAAGLTLVLTASFLGVQSATLSAEVEDAILHLETLQFAVTFFLMVLVPQLRKLGELTQTDEADHVKALEASTGGRTSRSWSVDIKKFARDVRSRAGSSQVGGSYQVGKDQVSGNNTLELDTKSLHSYQEAQKSPCGMIESPTGRNNVVFFQATDPDYDEADDDEPPPPLPGPNGVLARKLSTLHSVSSFHQNEDTEGGGGPRSELATSPSEGAECPRTMTTIVSETQM